MASADEDESGGSPLQGLRFPVEQGVNLEAIQAHIAQHIGPIELVFHEMLSDIIHLDVLWVAATEERPFHLLITSGVSDQPMTVPAGAEMYRRAELVIALPPDWPLTMEAFKDERNYWPIRWLKQFGRFPHEYGTWIGARHTIPNGNPAELAPGTGFMSVILEQFAIWDGFFRLPLPSGEDIRFYVLLPLYEEELELKIKQGAEALEERLQRAGIGFVVETDRPNVALSQA